MKASKLAIIFLVIFLLGCTSHEKLDAKDVLNKAIEKCNSTSFEVTIVKSISIGNKSLGTKEVEHGIFNGSKFRIESKSGVTISNGSTVWMYNNITGFLIVTDFSNSNEKPQNVFTSFLLRLLNYNLSLNATQNSYVVIGVKDKHAIKVWIDKKTFIPQRSEIKSKLYGLNVTYVSEFKNLTFRRVDNSEFNAKFPKTKVMRIVHFQDIENAEKMLNFSVVKLHNPDLKLKIVSVIEREGVKAIALQYVKKECPVIIIESPQYNLTAKGEEITISGIKAFYNYNSIEFKFKNVTINVLSNCLSKQEFVNVVESMIT